MPAPLLRYVLLLVVAIGAAGCSDAAAPSFNPIGPCTADGVAPGAYPDLEALVPASYRGDAPQSLDSGRNCTASSLGSLVSLGYREVRFAGGTWTFGAERAVVLAVFGAPGLDVDALADFFAESARAANRTEVLGESSPSIARRPGRRLDTKTAERLQTVVVWPSAEPDLVNVVITNDLPEARITEAIDAFGDE